MKLSKTAISRLTGNRKAILALALKLNFTELWVNKLVSANKENGPLTNALSLSVLNEELGLTNDQILESSEVEDKANTAA